MNICPIASSSKGNAYLVSQKDGALLIDCGISLKRLKTACDLSQLCGVLITHNHTDHTSGLKYLLKCCDVPVYANLQTAEAVSAQEHLDDTAFVCFENGQTFDVGPFSVLPFSVPHDASDPVGYLIRGELTYFHGTDIGTPLDSIGLHLSEAELATVESNHDVNMLMASQRPPSLKQRIYGSYGHLSNDQACELVRRFASPRLKHLYLAHLSHDCNLPHVALKAMQGTLADMGRVNVEVEVA